MRGQRISASEGLPRRSVSPEVPLRVSVRLAKRACGAEALGLALHLEALRASRCAWRNALAARRLALRAEMRPRIQEAEGRGLFVLYCLVRQFYLLGCILFDLYFGSIDLFRL